MSTPVRPPLKKSSNPLLNRERYKLARQHMPEQEAQARASQFTEVNLGYSRELARQEALRQACLHGRLSRGR